MVAHVFDNSSLSQEIFAIDTWGAVICSLIGTWSQAHAYDPSNYMWNRLKFRVELQPIPDETLGIDL